MKVERGQALCVHRQRFGREGQIFAAPARVNLIGEHTDYTGGFVMPMAIGFQTVAVVSTREDNRAVFYSANYDEEVGFELSSLKRAPLGSWSDYAAGVLWSLREEGVTVGGFNLSLAGDVPLGAGLSSSASVEVATAMALLSRAEWSCRWKGSQPFAAVRRMNLSARRVALWTSLRLRVASRIERCYWTAVR